MAALLEANPSLHGVVSDQPATAAAARRRFGRRRSSRRRRRQLLRPAAGGRRRLHAHRDHPSLERRGSLRHPPPVRSRGRRFRRVFVIEKIGDDGAAPNTEMDLRLGAFIVGPSASCRSLLRSPRHPGSRSSPCTQRTQSRSSSSAHTESTRRSPVTLCTTPLVKRPAELPVGMGISKAGRTTFRWHT